MLRCKKDKQTALDKEVDRVIQLMTKESPASDEYANLQNVLDKLLSAKQRKEPRKEKLSINTIVEEVFGIGEIFLIMGYERINILTTKAWGRIRRRKT